MYEGDTDSPGYDKLLFWIQCGKDECLTSRFDCLIDRSGEKRLMAVHHVHDTVNYYYYYLRSKIFGARQ